MSTDVTAAPATTSSTNLKLGELLTTGPQSIAFLSALLLTSSANEDFSLGKKETLLTQPGSFKISAQQVVNATDKAYVANDAAFNSLRFTLSQVPQSINIFLFLLNQGSADEIKFLGQNTLTDISKQITKAVEFSVKAEKSFDDVLTLVQELLLGTLATPGGQALQQVERKDFARDAKIAFEEARKRFEEASKSIPADWALAGDSITRSLADSNPTAAQSTSASAEALRAAQASLAAAQKQFEEASKNIPSGWDLVGAQVAGSLQGGISSGGNKATTATPNATTSQAEAAAKERAAAALHSTQAALAEAQKQYNNAINHLPAGWDLVGVLASQATAAAQVTAAAAAAEAKPPPASSTTAAAHVNAAVAAAERFRAAREALEAAQKAFQDAIDGLPSGWDLVGQNLIDSLKPKPTSKQAEVPSPAPTQAVRGPVPDIVEYLRKMIDSYQRHTAQVKQITQLLRSAQAITDKAAPKAVEGLPASLSSSDQTNAVAAPKEDVVTLGSLQRDTVIQQGQNLLEIVEAVNGVCAVYLKVNKDYTLAGQRKLGEMIQFPEGRTLARDDKAFLARLDEKKAEVLKANDETTKKILELYGGV